MAIDTLDPETTVRSIRQLSEAEMIACDMRKQAAELIRLAEALEIAYGVVTEPTEKIVFEFDPRKTKKKR
jgi:hypothetical protein